jgi:hypothetical protein
MNTKVADPLDEKCEGPLTVDLQGGLGEYESTLKGLVSLRDHVRMAVSMKVSVNELKDGVLQQSWEIVSFDKPGRILVVRLVNGS